MAEKTIKIGEKVVDLSTTTSRGAAFEDFVRERMRDKNIGRSEAWDQCLNDPALKPLVDAMINKGMESNDPASQPFLYPGSYLTRTP